jgi:sulfatase modifying factor 1
LIILDAVDMVEIPPGWFWMGRDDGARGEQPRRLVWTEGFAIGLAPVTNRDYAPYLDATGATPPPWWSDPRFDHPEQPVVGVNWFEAVAFCDWLSRRLGPPYRLPTEAEWERAARGGRSGARFPWGDERPATGTFDRPPLVSDTPANPLGLVALSGVCHEWCLDWEDEQAGTRRSSRGGAWRHQDPWSMVTHHSSLPPHLRYSDYGFRVVRTPV